MSGRLAAAVMQLHREAAAAVLQERECQRDWLVTVSVTVSLVTVTVTVSLLTVTVSVVTAVT